MKFLLFLLGLVFFFIFYLFSHVSGVEGSFIPDLFWIANIYVLITLGIIGLIFASHRGGKQESIGGDDEEEKKQYIPSSGELISFVRNIFSYYIYYIACALFYVALYFILQSFYQQASIPLLFVFINSIVISLYFLEHKFKLFQNFVRVNLLLVSLYYIFVHVQYLLGFGHVFGILDFINIVGVFVLFGITIFSGKNEKYLKILRHYGIAFCFLEIATLYKIFFSGELLSLGVIAEILGVLSLVFTEKIQGFTKFPKGIIRFWGIIFLCIFSCISLFYLGGEDVNVLFLMPGLCLSGALLYLFHQRFQNYLALGCALIGFMGAFYGAYGIILSENSEKVYLFSLCFFFSACILLLDSLSKKRSLYDTYFFHSLSLLVNLLGVFYFFYFRDFSILSLGILLLGESIYLFFSYYTISKTKTLG